MNRPTSTRPRARCIVATADLHAAPDAASERVSQCLFGETVELLATTGRWHRVRNRRDRYTGYLSTDAIEAVPADIDAGTRHLVGVRATLLFAAPDLKSPVRLRVPFGAELRLDDDTGDRHGTSFVRVSGLTDADGAVDGFVRLDHCLAPGATLAGSPVELARRLHDGAPYLWGGRTPDGTDCSGLLQGTALALGIRLPRDSGDQERALTCRVPHAERAASDAVFWPGHVALLVDADTVFHATAHALATAIEPLADVIRRAGEPTSIRRLPLVSRDRGAA